MRLDLLKVGMTIIVPFPVGEDDSMNEKGVIKTIDKMYGQYGVEFFNNIGGHDISGNGKDEHCWYLEGDEQVILADTVEEIE